MPEIRFEAKIDEALIVPLDDAPRPHRDPLELQPLDQTLRYRKAPRIPRDTEPCHLWEFIAFGAGGMAVLVGLLWLAGWSFSKLLEVLS